MSSKFNTADYRITYAIQQANRVLYSNPEIDVVLTDLDLLIECREHLLWYGESSAEYQLINCLVNLVRMLKTSSSTNKPGMTIKEWLGEQPIRNALAQRLSKALNEPQAIIA